MTQLLQAQFRHAKHYFLLLQAAEKLYRKGGDALQQALQLVDEAWPNMTTAQAWVVANAQQREVIALLGSCLMNLGPTLLDLHLSPTEIITWAGETLKAAQSLKQKNYVDEGAALAAQGRAYLNLGKPLCTIQCLEQALSFARQTAYTENVCSMLINLGQAYYVAAESVTKPSALKRRLQQARNCFDEAMQLTQQMHDRSREALILGNLGSLYHRLNLLPQAEQCYRTQLAIAQDLRDRRTESNALTGIGNVIRKTQPHEAAECYLRQLAIARELGDVRGEIIALFNHSLVLHHLGQKAEAIAQVQTVLPMYERVLPKEYAKVKQQLEEWEEQ